MADLALNDQHDLALNGTTFGLVYDADYRAQRMRIALKHRMGEWFRDESQGTDYDNAILGKSTELSRRAEVRRRVLQVPGIREIVTLRTSLDRVSRHWSAEIEVVQDDGQPLEVRFTGRV